ncbi:unnamed protein product [Symbiodinium sp. CCMP2592]|nr:unnamed protein product [Symbiodinium sp. CCMP2592]
MDNSERQQQEEFCSFLPGRESAGWPTSTSSGSKVSFDFLRFGGFGSEALCSGLACQPFAKADRLVQFLSGLRAVLPADDLAPASEERWGLLQKAHLYDSSRVVGPRVLSAGSAEPCRPAMSTAHKFAVASCLAFFAMAKHAALISDDECESSGSECSAQLLQTRAAKADREASVIGPCAEGQDPSIIGCLVSPEEIWF